MPTILLIGKTGQVGFELERALCSVGQLIAPGRTELDLSDPDSIRRAVQASRPDVIVNAAGFTIVDESETQPGLAMQLNATAPGVIAECANRAGALLVHYSTSFVFDGTKREPYTENDAPNPVNHYGRSKLAGERAIAATCPQHIILRANWVYSARRTNFALAMLNSAHTKPEISVVNDQAGSPTWARDYADTTAVLLQDIDRLRASPGIYHLSAHAYCTRLQWAQKLFASAKTIAGSNASWATLHPTTSAQYPHAAPRPLYTVTCNRKFEDTFGIRMPAWDERVAAFVRTLVGG